MFCDFTKPGARATLHAIPTQPRAVSRDVTKKPMDAAAIQARIFAQVASVGGLYHGRQG